MLIVSASGEDTASPLQDLFELVNQSAKREFEDEEKERGKAGRIHCGVGIVEGREDDLFADLLSKDI